METPFTPENLRELAKKVDEIHGEALFGIDPAGASPESEQLYLLGISCLEQAKRYFTLANMAQTRAIVRSA